MINLTINGKKVTAHEGETILEVALRNDIYIPNLCYDKRLRPYGGCRLCIVEVEGQRRLFAACSSPAEEGMVVHTETPKLNKLRQTVIELLLVHHPLECPECDKAGECDLQDLAYKYGKPEARFIRHRKTSASDIRGPLIELTARRCILCGKCVRICDEHQGRAALGLISRGFPTVVQPAFGEVLECDYCGQCVDICPTGAILSKTYKYTARAWFLEERDTICPFCGIGCTITVGLREGRILRSRGIQGKGVNDGNLCGRGRFGIDYIYSESRLKNPMIKRDGEFVDVTWEEALKYVAQNLKAIIDQHGPQAIGAIGSPRCTNEDNYMLRKFMTEVIGSHNIDSSSAFGYTAVQGIWSQAFGRKNHPIKLTSPIGKDIILIIESDPSVTHPVFGLNILQAKRQGAELIVIDSRETKLTRHSTRWYRIKDGTNVALLNGIIHTILKNDPSRKKGLLEIPKFDSLEGIIERYDPQTVQKLTGITPGELDDIVKRLLNASNRLFVLSVRLSENTTDTDTVAATCNLVNVLGDDPEVLQIPAEFSNTYGAYEAGIWPDQKSGGRGIFDMFYRSDSPIKALYIMGEDPLTTFPDTHTVQERLSSLDFIVVQDIFMTETAKMANVVLPASSWAEKDGTFTNAEGLDQRVYRLVDPAGQSMPDWLIIRNLTLTMERDLGVRNLEAIQKEMADLRKGDEAPTLKRQFIPVEFSGGEEPDSDYPLRLVIRDILPHSGIMSTRSKALDLVISEALLEINERDAEKYGVINGSYVELSSRKGSIYIKTKTSEEVPEGTVFVPSHFPFSKINSLTHLDEGGNTPIIAVRISPAP